ncbi:MAG: hypothetical protein ACRDJN_16185 [Chloroflexota bacterium]
MGEQEATLAREVAGTATETVQTRPARRPRIVRRRGVMGVIEAAHSLLYRVLLVPVASLR